MAEDNTLVTQQQSNLTLQLRQLCNQRASKRSKNNLGDAVDKEDTSIVGESGGDTVSSSSNNILITSRANDFSSKTWWMVDMHNDDNGENSTTQGATALVKRCMRVHNWSLERTRKVLTAYRQFLTLKKEHKDWNATILSPSYLVDQMWHQHILDVVNYTHDMMLLCGHVVGHNPDGALDLQKKAKRDETTRKALEKRFANKYDKEIWGVDTSANQGGVMKTEVDDNTVGGPIRIRIRGQWSDPVLEVKMKRSTKMGKVVRVYAQTLGLDVNSLRGFMLDGEHVSERDTPSSLGLEDNDQIDAIMVQSGC